VAAVESTLVPGLVATADGSYCIGSSRGRSCCLGLLTDCEWFGELAVQRAVEVFGGHVGGAGVEGMWGSRGTCLIGTCADCVLL